VRLLLFERLRSRLIVFVVGLGIFYEYELFFCALAHDGWLKGRFWEDQLVFAIEQRIWEGAGRFYLRGLSFDETSNCIDQLIFEFIYFVLKQLLFLYHPVIIYGIDCEIRLSRPQAVRSYLVVCCAVELPSRNGIVDDKMIGG
jgi:hypothetical protein